MKEKKKSIKVWPRTKELTLDAKGFFFGVGGCFVFIIISLNEHTREIKSFLAKHS